MRSLKITLILAIVCLALVGLTATNKTEGTAKEVETFSLDEGAKVVTGGTIKEKHEKPGQNNQS